jgi:hypothetical protein
MEESTLYWNFADLLVLNVLKCITNPGGCNRNFDSFFNPHSYVSDTTCLLTCIFHGSDPLACFIQNQLLKL